MEDDTFGELTEDVRERATAVLLTPDSLHQWLPRSLGWSCIHFLYIFNNIFTGCTHTHVQLMHEGCQLAVLCQSPPRVLESTITQTLRQGALVPVLVESLAAACSSRASVHVSVSLRASLFPRFFLLMLQC